MSQTTGGGIQVPTISDDPDVPRDTLRIVTDVEPKLVYQFNTATERDAAAALVDFKECWVGDTKYNRIGTGSTWRYSPGTENWGSVRAYRSIGQNLASGTWVSLGITGADFTTGSGLAAHPDGIAVSVAGVYSVSATLALPGSGTGSRQIGISTSTSIGAGNFEIGVTDGANGLSEQRLNCAGLLQTTGATIIRLWARQSSGSILVAADRWLMATRVA